MINEEKDQIIRGQDASVWKMEFDREHDGSLTIESAIFQALGAASMCWVPKPGNQLFDSDRAKIIGDTLVEFIGDEVERLLAEAARGE